MEGQVQTSLSGGDGGEQPHSTSTESSNSLGWQPTANAGQSTEHVDVTTAHTSTTGIPEGRAGTSLRVAFVGCSHGELDTIYNTLEWVAVNQGVVADLLICTGDFEALRNPGDLETMAVPEKYRHMNAFADFYSGKKTAPIPTLVLGGNHEASAHFHELRYGGWLAPRMWYMGNASVVRFGPLRIGGISGIYKGNHYKEPHYEFPPYTASSMRSAYHIRSVDVARLARLQPDSVDIMCSHDWPLGMSGLGDSEGLLRTKPYFRKDHDAGELGSPPAAALLHALRPRYWASGHLHVKHTAQVHHPPGSPTPVTNFLALDKPIPRRPWLQFLDIPVSQAALDSAAPGFALDLEWAALLKETANMGRRPLPNPAVPGPPVAPAAVDWVRAQRASVWPDHPAEKDAWVPIPGPGFHPIVPLWHGPSTPFPPTGWGVGEGQRGLVSPQTAALMEFLGICDSFSETHGGPRYPNSGALLPNNQGGAPAAMTSATTAGAGGFGGGQPQSHGQGQGQGQPQQAAIPVIGAENPEALDLDDDDDDDE